MVVLCFSTLGTYTLASSLASELNQDICSFRSNLFADATKYTYKTHRDTYLRFCYFMGHNPIPASTLLICQYTAFLARSLKFSSIKNYLGIISLLHKEMGLPNPLLDNWYHKSLLTGIKHRGDKVHQKLPITLDILKGICHILNVNSSYDASFWATCLIAFFVMFRKSHHFPISASKFDGNKHFTRSCFKFFPWGALIEVKWSKTIQFREHTVHIPIPYIAGAVLCPVTALLHSMSFTASRATANSHAFAYLHYDSLSMKYFTYHSFIYKLRDSLQSLGLSHGLYAGHSFRRGGATVEYHD